MRLVDDNEKIILDCAEEFKMLNENDFKVWTACHTQPGWRDVACCFTASILYSTKYILNSTLFQR